VNPMTPHLWVEDMGRSIAFYRDVLGFEVISAEPTEAPTFASLHRPDANLMLSPFHESFGDWPMVPLAQGRRGSGGAVSFYMEGGDDLEADYRRALDAGVKVVDEIRDRPWGQREFTIEDLDGFWWAVWKAPISS
jgi:uncharacterized glyoxalase superfamily protein PhnB